jgi:two-component system, NarL family, invasion response regulator UvrY
MERKVQPQSPPHPIRVLIADDHAVVRKGLKQIFEEFPDIQVAGEATTAGEALQYVRDSDWDAVVLDITMPDRSGLEVLREIKGERPTLPVLVLSMHEQKQYAARVLRAGASAYLQKESSPEELVQALRSIHSGDRYLTPAQAQEVAFLLQHPSDRPPHETLSNREFEVLCRIGSGQTISQIAADLKLSVKTVSTYRTRLLDKMRMRTNAEVTHYAIKNCVVR